MSKSDKAHLNFNNQTVELPIRSPTYGTDVIEIKKLGSQGLYTLDPGFYSTASCESHITYIDGREGILLYRGYPIDQLAFNGDYMDVCFTLMRGELPNRQQKENFINKIKQFCPIDKQFSSFFTGFHPTAHPMAMLISVVGALSAYCHNDIDVTQQKDRETAAIQLLAKVPTLAAMCYRYSIEKPFISPDPSLSYAENFLSMMFDRDENKPIDPVISQAIDRIFILHADHEQNASTSTVRLAGSTGANPFACIAAGIAALWGPAHGGANEACLSMLNEIGDESHIETYLARAKDKKDPFRLMGFGHRVYKNYDPRARVMQKTCHEVLEATGSHDTPLFKLALKLEKIALEDEYFIKKKLYPNVDFYSGLTLSALGIPMNMFTVIFSLARTVGWISHWMEMMNDPTHTLARPRQLYLGPKKRDFVEIDNRK